MKIPHSFILDHEVLLHWCPRTHIWYRYHIRQHISRNSLLDTIVTRNGRFFQVVFVLWRVVIVLKNAVDAAYPVKELFCIHLALFAEKRNTST